jgi:hypothetical protein
MSCYDSVVSLPIVCQKGTKSSDRAGKYPVIRRRSEREQTESGY